MKQRYFLLGCVPLLFACQTISGPPRVGTELAVLSEFVFRGSPQRSDAVLQPAVDVSLGTSTGESVDFGFWGNLDLTSAGAGGTDLGSNAGTFSRVDWKASSSTTFGGTALTFGVRNYSYPGSRAASTSEVFLIGGWDAFGLAPTLAIFADIDAVKGIYANFGVSGGREMNEKTRAIWTADLGLTDRDHALRYYLTPASGLADLNVTGSFVYAYSTRSTIRVVAALTTLLTTAHRDALDAAGSDDTNLWFGVVFDWGI